MGAGVAASTGQNAGKTGGRKDEEESPRDDEKETNDTTHVPYLLCFPILRMDPEYLSCITTLISSHYYLLHCHHHVFSERICTN